MVDLATLRIVPSPPKVINKSVLELDISHFLNGVYYVGIDLEKTSVCKKIIIDEKSSLKLSISSTSDSHRSWFADKESCNSLAKLIDF